MKQLIVDIADCKISKNPNIELITYSLGSCIGVAIWDPEVRVGGMLHYMLSDSKLSPDKAASHPAMFADTGIAMLFNNVYEAGAMKRRLIVKIAGGGAFFQTDEAMDIGKHNYVALRKIFWHNNVLIDGEHIGGTISRTMRLHIGTGEVTVENRKMGRIAI